jgi:hypothetical protein
LETATPTFRFLKRTKLPGFGKLVLSEVDMDLVVDSKYQDTLRYRLYDTGKLQQEEEMREETIVQATESSSIQSPDF